MPKLKLLRSLARYDVLTPFAVLAAAALAQPAAAVDWVVTSPDTDGFELLDGDSLENQSAISNSFGPGVSAAGNVGSITNATGASIWSQYEGLFIGSGTLGLFTNDGTITGNGDVGVGVTGAVGSFINEDDGSIAGDVGVSFSSTVDNFYNAGEITGNNGTGAHFEGPLQSFTNAAGASITSTSSEGVVLYGPVDTFFNAGMITGILGVGFHGTVDTFRNEAGGVIEGANDYAARFWGAVADFYNAGTISGGFESAAQFELVVDRFVNAGTISSVRGITFEDDVGTFRNEAGAVIEGTDDEAINFNTSVDDFYNAGIIRGGSTGVFLSAAMSKGVNAAGGVITGQTGSAIMSDGNGEFVFDNAATISGEMGIEIIGWGPQSSRITNSGTIEGTMGTAIHFGTGVGAEPRDDKLTLLTGSRILGDVDFALGNDTLDFSGFRGNTLLDVANLETVVAGSVNYVWDQPNEQIAIFDIAGTTGVGGQVSDVTGAVNGVIGGLFGPDGQGGAGPFGYAPARPQTPAEAAVESAVLSELDVGAAGTKIWASAFGGRSTDSAPVASSHVFGGIVAGSHVRLLDSTDLGLVGGYVRSQYAVSGLQPVATETGLLGLYGRTGLGTVDVSFSLLGGYGGHQSTREVIALGVAETARASFGSWFVAPTLGLDLPVLSGESGELSIVGSAAYVGGSVAGYTETGSSMNLTVGSQTIGAFDSRIGLAGRLAMASIETGDISLQAKAGIFAQANFGSSTVPVTVLGQTTNASTTSGSGYGVYAGTGLEADLTEHVGINAGIDASLRSDGLVAGAAKAGVQGTF